MGRPAKVTREQVLAAAREAFAERGFDGTTLADIGARVGVSPAALLRHAPSKEALFSAAMATAPGAGFRLPIEFLSDLTGKEDPRRVIRRVAEAMVPFLNERIDQTVALWMRGKSIEGATGPLLPFDPSLRPTPPQRAVELIEGYLKRARRAGRVRLRDPRAAAIALLGSCHSYVFLHRVVVIQDPPYPLDRYIDALVDLWTRGAIVPSSGAAARKETS
ncbi:MAG TPA: TetR/AcrR family transcriptional regulator [Thermoanaerobaculia bacterium]|jgi:AcrR family transcriptional regulator|nr:TetR/AcrR family transcriptional regulator [Thermoanaerobaculia bacterium]